MKTFLYDWGGYNVVLFHFINGLQFRWLDTFAATLSTVLDFRWSPLYLFALAGLTDWRNRQSYDGWKTRRGRQRWNAVIELAQCLIVGIALSALLKHLFDMPRPLALLGDTVHVVGEPQLLHSFPSGHATLAGLLAAFFWPLSPLRLRILLAGLVPLMMLSRIVVGAHFPADVCAGAFLGLLTPALSYKLTELLRGGLSLRSPRRGNCRSS